MLVQRQKGDIVSISRVFNLIRDIYGQDKAQRTYRLGTYKTKTRTDNVLRELSAELDRSRFWQGTSYWMPKK